MTDPIADMLTRIRNAQAVKKATVEVPASKIKKSIAEILIREGYIVSAETIKIEGSVAESIHIVLKYVDKKKAITGIKRISIPGLRVYSEVATLPRVLGGLGIAIVSTSKGIMTDKEARKENIGGEVLAYVW
jgi:small subunit ribosomal protein S8